MISNATYFVVSCFRNSKDSMSDRLIRRYASVSEEEPEPTLTTTLLRLVILSYFHRPAGLIVYERCCFNKNSQSLCMYFVKLVYLHKILLGVFIIVELLTLSFSFLINSIIMIFD